MKFAPIALCFSSLLASVDAVQFRELVQKATRRNSSAEAAVDEPTAKLATTTTDSAADTSVEELNRELQISNSNNGNCWQGNPGHKWHPVYAAGWTDGYCRYTVDCNSPGFGTQLACCKAAYAGQISGYCLADLPNPPTMSPTDTGGLDVYYPNYETAWTDAGCSNERPMPSGRPIYSDMLACCKGAYAGQVSGKCLSMLPTPPTTSPTNSDYEADFWYPMYEDTWSDAGCSNKLPLPFKNKNDRPNYSSELTCCKGAYSGQNSGACLANLPSPPGGGDLGSDVWYRDYSIDDWNQGTCTNGYPLPIQITDWNTHSSKEACCNKAFAGQVSNACVCSLDDKPTVCYEIKTTTVTSTIDPSSLGVTIPSPLPTGSTLTTLANTLKSQIKAQIEAFLGPDQKVEDITIVSIGGTSVNLRRLGESPLSNNKSIRSLVVNAVNYRADIEYICLAEECGEVESAVEETAELGRFWECQQALKSFKLLTEPYDTDVFVGDDEDATKAGDSYNWSGNKLCVGNDVYVSADDDCGDAATVGYGYGVSTYLSNDVQSYTTDEFYVLGSYGTLMVTSIEYPGSSKYAAITGGTGCFASASGQMTAEDVDEEYYNYDLSDVVIVTPQ